MSEYTASETCSCGASITVSAGLQSHVRERLEEFRTGHQHEMPAPTTPDHGRAGDVFSTESYVGFDAGRYGRIEEVV